MILKRIYILPVISQRIKQNLKEIPIDENVFIDVDEDSDNEFVADDDELLLVEDDCLPLQSTRNKRKISYKSKLGDKRKALNENVSRKRAKVKTESQQNINPNSLECTICMSSFSRKDNLLRHMKNKHK